MDHCDNAKVIITLLDYTSLALFFSLPCAHYEHTPMKIQRVAHTQTHRTFSQMSRLPGVVLGG